MKNYIQHEINSDARFSAQCYKHNNVIYTKLTPLHNNNGTSTKIVLDEFYKTLDPNVKIYPNITCIVNDDTFVGINSEVLTLDMLMGRYVEGIPILQFYIDKNNALKTKLDAFLVDNISLKPIEKLKLKIKTLYNIEQISQFNDKLDSIILKENVLMPDIIVPDVPKTYYPNLTAPQSIAYNSSPYKT